MIRNSFLIIAILSLFYGMVFLLIPEWFVNFSETKNINIAWLRSIGASIIGLLFIGCLYIYFNPVKKIELFRVITITSTLQTLALFYSRFFSEFSAKNLLVIDITIIIALIVTTYFILLNVYNSKYFN